MSFRPADTEVAWYYPGEWQLFRVHRTARAAPLGNEAMQPELNDYLLRAVSLFNRSPDLRQRFGSPEDPDFAKFVDTEAILYMRELQEVGIPFPPWEEMLTVGGETDLRLFLTIGYACFLSVRNHIPGYLLPPISLLDFGAGCGRTMRFFFREADRFACHACDVDRKAVAYLKENMPFVKAEATENLPPLPYLSGSFDLVYSISVFTHLDRAALANWLKEIHRVTKPGGVFLVTLHGERAFTLVSNEPERRNLIGISEEEFAARHGSFTEHGFVWMKQPVGSPDIDRSQFGISFVSRKMIEDQIRPYFEFVEYIDGEIGGWQDLAVLRKRTGRHPVTDPAQRSSWAGSRPQKR